MIKYLELEAELKKDLMYLVELHLMIVRMIREVGDMELRMILELRYLSYKKWEQIAEEMNCGLANVYRLHRAALESIRIPES